ncbi:hypothetical protein OY671_006012, partial [Metschnikowia pulcherrima]
RAPAPAPPAEAGGAASPWSAITAGSAPEPAGAEREQTSPFGGVREHAPAPAGGSDELFPRVRGRAAEPEESDDDHLEDERRGPSYTWSHYSILVAVAFVLGSLVWTLVSRDDPGSAVEDASASAAAVRTHVTATDRALELAVIAARAASDRKAEEIIALDVSEQLVSTDVFLIASGSSERQVSAIVDAVEEAMHKAGSKPIRREGKQEARWVSLDFGDVVVHVQHAEDRVYYALERSWKDCPVVESPEDARGGDGTADDTDDTTRGDGAIRLSGEPSA